MTPEQENQHLKQASHDELRAYIATKIRRARRLAKESQAGFASRAGVPLRTYKRLETHGQGHLDTFLKVLVALERAQYFYLLFPSDSPPQRVMTLEERIEAIRQRRG